MKSLRKQLALLAISLVSFLNTSPSFGADLPVFNTNYTSPNAACATFGDLISCSTKVLDYLTTLNPNNFPGPYSFSTAQGHLIDTVVLATNGGNIANNGDTVFPSEDAFSTTTGGQNYFYMGENNDPTNNGTLNGDTPYSWDIGIQSLINKLTFNNAFHQLLIGFDMNQPQNSTASLPIWSLITLRDSTGALTQNVYFETQALDPNNPFKSVTDFTSSKTFDGTGVTTPSAGDFALTVGSICVVSTTVSYPSPDGSSCPQGGQLVNTNQASNELEFVNYLPELDLFKYLNMGYDTISVQVWMGCFNTGDPKDKSGPALLGGGSVGTCDTGGFGDIFLLAGGEEFRTPEPGSLLLAALGLLLVGFTHKNARPMLNRKQYTN